MIITPNNLVTDNMNPTGLFKNNREILNVVEIDTNRFTYKVKDENGDVKRYNLTDNHTLTLSMTNYTKYFKCNKR